MMAQSSSGTSASCYVEGNIPRVKYQGTMKKSIFDDNFEYAAFLGIPYAACPIGLQRYQAPNPLVAIDPALLDESTIEDEIPTYKANKVANPSTQMNSLHKCEGSSDCLYLNIFLPKRPEDVKKEEGLFPVLVFIHGGGFTCGDSDPREYTPDLIVQQGLVFVTLNYRLGLFGFFNMHSETAPGNTGLKDQVRALEWIQKNIVCFKGNPENVTISGCSAGGTCVNLHLIAPMSQALFHKAIVQSGGIYSTWGYRGHRREQKNLLLGDQKLPELLLAEQESSALQTEADRLLRDDRRTRHPQSLSPLFGPSVEKYREGAFITDDIAVMMQKVDHSKPVMAGITKEEGIDEYMNPKTACSQWVNNDRKFCQFLMGNLRWSEKTANEFVDKIRDLYFEDRQRMTPAVKDRCMAKLITDVFFRRFYDNFKFGPARRVHENLYVYRFDHISEISSVVRFNKLQFKDATHQDELSYLFCPYELAQKLKRNKFRDEKLLKMMKCMCSLWANFCKTGIPTPSDEFAEGFEWRRHTQDAPCYLRIDNELTLVNDSLYRERWDKLNAIIEPQPVVPSLAATPDE